MYFIVIWKTLLFSFFCIFSFFNCYSFPILDPSDPQYNWMDELIEMDFSNKQLISKKQFDDSVNIFKDNIFIQHFIIRNNQVIYVSKEKAEDNNACRKILTHLCASYGLPDLDLLWYSLDGLMEAPKGSTPIFTICRRKGIKNTILFGHPYSLDWVDNMCKFVEDKIKNQEWDMLINKVYWRGNTTDGHYEYGGWYTPENWMLHPRGRACWLSLQYPHLIDAAFVVDPIFGLNLNKLKILKKVLPTSDRVSYEISLDYKYQLLVAGIVSPWSSDWKIHAGRVIFIHPMPWETYWDSLFKPWEHFIPIEPDYSDFIDKILWAIYHDEECKNMAIRSRNFMQTHANPEHMALYFYKVLLRYAKILDFS